MLSRLTETRRDKWLVLPPTPTDVARLWAKVEPARPQMWPGADRPFVLHVGGITPHHRPDLAWPWVSRHGYECHVLVILGEDWGEMPARSEVAGVERLCEVSDAELIWLYERCAALLVASVREGFCLPVVEAAAYSRRVIHTSTPGLDEALESVVDRVALPDAISRAVIAAPNPRAAAA